jgi:hypothetical protein
MSLSQAAARVEQAIGHEDNAVTVQDVTNPANDRAKYGDPNVTMKALAWMGKNDVQVIECPKPKIIEDRDVILKVTGSTICGSDLHLLHGTVIELQKGDILGHEFCGIIDEMGSAVKGLSKGDRVVASFQIACGACHYCDQKLSSQCTKTNANTIENSMYGGRTAGMFGYSHFTGGFAGGQAEYVRVPIGDVNLLKLPDNVPDEKGLYLSDVVSTSWNCVVDTGVKKGDMFVARHLISCSKLIPSQCCNLGRRTHWPDVCRFCFTGRCEPRYHDRLKLAPRLRQGEIPKS